MMIWNERFKRHNMLGVLGLHYEIELDDENSNTVYLHYSTGDFEDGYTVSVESPMEFIFGNLQKENWENLEEYESLEDAKQSVYYEYFAYMRQRTLFIEFEPYRNVFQQLGWNVNPGVKFYDEEGNIHTTDFLLINKNKIYGYVDVYEGIPTEKMEVMLDEEKKSYYAALVEHYELVLSEKPPLYIITNGYVYDIFSYGKHIGTHSLPPSAEDADIEIEIWGRS